MSNTLKEDLSDVLKFVKDCNDSFWSSDCEVKESSLGGLGVFAKRDIDKGTILLRIPKSSVFSASSCTIANLLLDEEIDGVLALDIAFLYETTVFKEKSHWYPYLKSIKIYDTEQQLILPPNYWSDEEKKALEGSTLDTLHDGLTAELEVKEGFEVAIDLARKWNAEFGLEIPQGFLDVDTKDMTDARLKYHRFVATAYAMSSRIFEIDAFHQNALVPIADLFNHSATAPDVHFSSLYDVCQLCGEPGICKHLMAEAALEEAQGHIPEQDEGRIPSKTDETTDDNHSESGEIEEEEEDDEEEDEDEDEDVDESKEAELVDITLVNDVKKGQEIFNSYGELSNPLLLARYGFSLEDNPNDVVHLAREIKRLVKQNKRSSLKASWWKEVGWALYSRWYTLMREPDDASDDEEQQEEEEEETEMPLRPWLLDMCIGFEGKPTHALRAFLNLLDLNEKNWRKLQDEVSSNPDKIDILQKNGDRGIKRFVAQLLADKERSQSATDEVFKSRGRINRDRSRNIENLLDSEKEILQRANDIFTR